MFGLNKDQKHIINLTEIAQRLISDLHANQPYYETFEQEGLLNGLSIIKEYIDQDEIALAIKHLLYMVYESDISYPKEKLTELCFLASKYKVNNFYSS